MLVRVTLVDINQKMVDAYSWDLWRAAYLINGGGVIVKKP